MFTKDFLAQIERAAFGQLFHEEIRSIFKQDVAKGKFGSEGADYLDAMKLLRKQLSEEKQMLLNDYEAVGQQILEFSAEYGFTAGIYCGFRQLFTHDCTIDGGFQKYVVEDISMKPKMEHHADNYANIEKRNCLYSQLTADESETSIEGLVAVSCYWSQAAHSASLNGFYCGYRAALSIKDKIAPFEGDYMTRVCKQLAMEHQLGYIESYSEIERRLAREQMTADRKP